jgi:hypothetical protein
MKFSIPIEPLDLWIFQHHWLMNHHAPGQLPYIPPLICHHN